MAEKIRFDKHVQTSSFHNPLLGNELDTQEMEIRRDPLTRAQSVFNPRLEENIVFFYGDTDHDLVERMARDSEPRCFLCGERWKDMTPTYPEDLVPGGRIAVGEAVLFPNLFPVAQVHAVIRVGERHFLPLDAFDARRVGEAFRAAGEFIRRLGTSDASIRFATLNGNYLGPAGASIAHPHFQVVAGDLACTYPEWVLEASRRYFDEHGTPYWADLVETEERIGQRYIGRTGPVHWLASYSPQGTNEILGILPHRRDFLEMDAEDLEGLAEGFSGVLKGYGAMGLSTFNFTLYSGGLAAGDAAFRCHLRIVSRQNVYENYRTDDYFLQKMLRNELILTLPEVLAVNLRVSMGLGGR